MLPRGGLLRGSAGDFGLIKHGGVGYAGQGRFAAGEVLINLRNSSTQRWAGTSRRPAAAVRTHSGIASGDSNAVRMRTASACADPSAEESVRPVGDELRHASTASRSPARPLPSPTRSRRWARPPTPARAGRQPPPATPRANIGRPAARTPAGSRSPRSVVDPPLLARDAGHDQRRLGPDVVQDRRRPTAWNCPPCREGGDSVSITRPPAGKPSRGDPSFHAPPDLGEVHAGPNPRRRAIGQPASTSRRCTGRSCKSGPACRARPPATSGQLARFRRLLMTPTVARVGCRSPPPRPLAPRDDRLGRLRAEPALQRQGEKNGQVSGLGTGPAPLPHPQPRRRRPISSTRCATVPRAGSAQQRAEPGRVLAGLFVHEMEQSDRHESPDHPRAGGADQELCLWPGRLPLRYTVQAWSSSCSCCCCCWLVPRSSADRSRPSSPERYELAASPKAARGACWPS